MGKVKMTAVLTQARMSFDEVGATIANSITLSQKRSHG